MNENEYLTKEKFDEFTKELAQRKGTKRKQDAVSFEYAEYHEARDVQATVEDRINKLEGLLKSATIISANHTNAVTVGSNVTVEKDGKKFIYSIVGSEEADVVSNKISIKSPFGQSIIGKKKGDNFSFSAPAGELSYKIVHIK